MYCVFLKLNVRFNHNQYMFLFFHLLERKKFREDCVVTLRVQQSQGIVSSESPEPEDTLITIYFRVQGQVGLERLVKEP
jgi:hypothetical protein